MGISAETFVRRRREVPLWVALISVAVAVAATAMAGAIFTGRELAKHAGHIVPALREAERLRMQYGPARYSRNYEEWIVRDHFQDRRGGVYLDVGANHYKNESNTYFLEVGLGWSGVAVEPLEMFRADYLLYRPKTIFAAVFATDRQDTTVRFFAADNHLVSSADPAFVQREKASARARIVPATTLDSVLDQAGIDRIDFLSMDIELAEPKALAGFDIERFRPALACVEAHEEVRQPILDYFAAHDYVVVGKYLRTDPHNLYFQPRDHPGAERR